MFFFVWYVCVPDWLSNKLVSLMQIWILIQPFISSIAMGKSCNFPQPNTPHFTIIINSNNPLEVVKMIRDGRLFYSKWSVNVSSFVQYNCPIWNYKSMVGSALGILFSIINFIFSCLCDLMVLKFACCSSPFPLRFYNALCADLNLD